MKPITNLTEPLTQLGGNGGTFELRYRRPAGRDLQQLDDEHGRLLVSLQ